MSGDLVPRKVRLVIYVIVILAEAATIILKGFDVITGDQAAAITTALGMIAAGLALGYVPRREQPAVERDPL